MSEVFISYARSTEASAQRVGEALRALGYDVWRDDELPAHRSYAEVIEERLKAAKAVVVIWSAEAVQSEWVQSEADRARAAHKLVQLRIDRAALPMPFDRIQCADLVGWSGDPGHDGWGKVLASIAELAGRAAGASGASVMRAPLSLPGKPSVAVMPLANLSGDAEQDYFADGMVEEITNALSLFKSIFVIASSSTLSFKGNTFSAQEAARRLGVRYVLEGSVRKAGGRVRIAVKLVDGADGVQIWSDRFEDTLEDVFALQDRVALSVAAKIEPTVQQAEIRRASARPTDNMGSYDLYLRALPLYRTLAKEGVLEALDLLDRAIALDPNFGLALNVAANCQRVIFRYGWTDDPERTRRQGIDLVHRALKSAADDAGVLAGAAFVLATLEQDPDAALNLVEKAVALNPGSASAWMDSGIMHLQVGETNVAIDHFETSMRLDPQGPNGSRRMSWMALARFQQGRFKEAVALSKESLVEQTDNPRVHAILAASFGHLGQTSAAFEALTQYCKLTPQPVDVFARSTLLSPTHLNLFLDGIALAEGKAPPEGPVAANVP